MSRRAWLVALLVLGSASVTWVVFGSSLHHGFTDWDDPINFLDNPHYRGLGWRQLRWMLTTNLMGHWIPVTWLTLGGDYALWGMNPFGYHLTNLVWHAASTVLFYFVAARLLGLAMPAASPRVRGVGAAAAALFFSIHPLRVESVVWITERRDLTSGFFFLLAVLSYLQAHARPDARRIGWRLVGLGAAALALGSKAIVMGLPLVLVILDIYPLRRLGSNPRGWLSARVRPVWLEKIPYLLLAVAAAVVALAVQHRTGYLTPEPLAARMAITVHNLWFHAWKTFVPLDLSPVYEVPRSPSLLQAPYLASAFGVIAITAVLWVVRHRWPAGLATWAFYLVVLAPVSGLVHTGYHLGADRNTYVSCAGFAVLVGALVVVIAQARRRRALRASIAGAALTLCALWIVGLGLGARVQATVWRDPETLWRYAVEVDPTCAVCQHNLAVNVGLRGDYEEALAAFERAFALRPDRTEFRVSYGQLLMHMGRRAEGLAALRARLDESPGDLVTRRILALALMQDGRPREAIAELEIVLRGQPDSPLALDALGRAYLMQGRAEPAVATFRRAIAVSPKDPGARLGLARAHLAGGDRAAAREQIAILRGMDPGLAAQVAQEFQ
jgi:Flp pilus assembly protein TadD